MVSTIEAKIILLLEGKFPPSSVDTAFSQTEMYLKYNPVRIICVRK